jgi:protein arginine N-methyltransferase 1
VTYNVGDYVAMIADPHRTGAYVRALRKMVTPATVVLDLGSGFGFFAVLAARLGARHAYAIDPNDAIALGPALARANGVADRVSFIHGDARRANLPERANLLVEDVRGVLPLSAGRIALLRDARERLLTSDARVVARRDRIWAAPARHPPSVQRSVDTTGADTHGIDLRGLRRHVVDEARRGKSTADDLLLPGALVGTLDLETVTDPRFEGTAHWKPDAELVADGFVLWFDAELAEGEAFSTRPGPAQAVHGSLYLPLREPLTVPSRSDLSLRFCGHPTSPDYTWTWECAVAGEDGHGVRTSRQSALGGLVVTPARLAASSELHRPVLGLEGRRLGALVALVESSRSTGEIAAAMVTRPTLEFSDEADAFTWVMHTLPRLEPAETPTLLE